MKLFMAAVRFKHKHHDRTGAEVLVHAKTRTAAVKHLEKRYPASKLERISELKSEIKHFVIADVVE